MPMIIGGTENECACLMPQYLNEGGRKLKLWAENFDQLGPELLLGIAPEDVTEEDSATANILRIEYMNEGRRELSDELCNVSIILSTNLWVTNNFNVILIVLETCGSDTNLTMNNIYHIEKMLTDTAFLVPMDRKVKEFTKQLSKDEIPVYYFRYR